MTDVAKQFIAQSRHYLTTDYLPKIEGCLEALSDEDVWWRANDASNSIGNLLLHLSGSTRMWIVSVVGNAPSNRDREREFAEREQIPHTELIARLKQTLADCDAVLAGVTAEQLLEQRQTSHGEVTVLEAIYHAVEHFAMHTGQIIMLTKARTGKALGPSA